MNRQSRRQFVQGLGVAGLGLLAGCGRLPAHEPAPSPTAHARVGILGGASAESSAQGAAFVQTLAGLGYVEGRNLSLEYRRVDDRGDRLPELAAELVSLPVDIILAGGPTYTRAARDATSTIPIVMIFPGDPVADGLVASLEPVMNWTRVFAPEVPLR